jgi:hypothetical protein
MSDSGRDKRDEQSRQILDVRAECEANGTVARWLLLSMKCSKAKVVCLIDLLGWTS